MPKILETIYIKSITFKVAAVNKKEGLVFLERQCCPEKTTFKSLLISIAEFKEWKKYNKKALKIVRRSAA